MPRRPMRRHLALILSLGQPDRDGASHCECAEVPRLIHGLYLKLVLEPRIDAEERCRSLEEMVASWRCTTGIVAQDGPGTPGAVLQHSPLDLVKEMGF